MTYIVVALLFVVPLVVIYICNKNQKKRTGHIEFIIGPVRKKED